MGYKRLDAEDFVVSADAVQSTAWSTDAATLSTFFTSSVQAAGTSGNYYLSIYQSDPTISSTGAAIQFDIAYGNKIGSGSEYFNSAYTNLTPATSIYGQYRSMILEDENSDFQFGTSTNVYTPNDFWALSIDRARYKEKIYPQTFNLQISGSGGLLKLTSNVNDTQVQTFLGSSRVLQVVSGSDGTAVSGGGEVAGSGSYGLLFPELGTVLLNPAAISQSIQVDSNKGPNLTNGTNQATLYDAINLGSSFTLNSEETITSDYVFVRSRNSEFNYSVNPSFISGSTGELTFSQFINNPQVYITTIGMYNDANELLAVAKLSRPLLKDFTKESLIRVKLDF
jgi:hypothetical protein